MDANRATHRKERGYVSSLLKAQDSVELIRKVAQKIVIIVNFGKLGKILTLVSVSGIMMARKKIATNAPMEWGQVHPKANLEEAGKFRLPLHLVLTPGLWLSIIYMKFPDNTDIQVGQRIWINEGTSQAIVAEVIEDIGVLKKRGLTEIGIFVDLSNAKSPPYSCDLFIAEKYFLDEGVGCVHICEQE